MSRLDFSRWPVVPEDQRPKKLYYLGHLDGDQGLALVAAGWEPVDVRLLPETTDDERIFAVKAWLQGVRLGSIEAKAGLQKFVELEAKTLGILVGKKVTSDAVAIDKTSLDAILSFGKESGHVDKAKG